MLSSGWGSDSKWTKNNAKPVRDQANFTVLFPGVVTVSTSSSAEKKPRIDPMNWVRGGFASD
jgi:hypothetical protein